MNRFAIIAVVLLACNLARCRSLTTAKNMEILSETIPGRELSLARINGKVGKTIIEYKLRLSVMVGLEGSGHHYLLASYENLFEANDTIAVDATDCIGMTPYWTERSMVKSPSSYSQNLERATKAMRWLAEQGRRLSGPGHISALCHFISYPTDYGPQKVMQYLDLGLLAEVAEAERVDLRTIYLKRSAQEIVIANTVHRNFQKTLGMDPHTTPTGKLFMEYMRVLLTDIAVVQSMLAELDPAFIVCHDYALSGDKEQASKIAHFVAPNDIVAAMYESALTKTWKAHSKPGEAIPIENADVIVARLQRKLDSFENIYCPNRS